MGEWSIYAKTCPTCDARLPRDAVICPCGYRFDDAVVESNDAQITDEELYLNYLTARLDQTMAELENARAALARYPKNFDCAVAVMRALGAVRESQDILKDQQAKIEALRAASPPPKAEIPPTAAAPADSQQDSKVRTALSATTLQSLLAASPDAAFRALQAANAARIMARQPQRCPSCGQLIAHDQSRCSCGYEISRAALNGTGNGAPEHEKRK